MFHQKDPHGNSGFKYHKGMIGLGLVVMLLIVISVPLLDHANASPKTTNLTQNDNSVNSRGPTPEEMKKMDEILRKLEEEDKKNPRVFIPEPNVYVGTIYEGPDGVVHVSPGRRVTDEEGNFITTNYSLKGTCPPEYDHYYDFRGHEMWVINGDHIAFRKVTSTSFAGTYFSVYDAANYCINCESGVQTVEEYWSPTYVKSYVESAYPDYDHFHIKYFINSHVDDYVYKTRYDYVNIYNYRAELWSEANYYRNGTWVKYGYPDYYNGGASYILNKRLFVSVGCHYYGDFSPFWYYYRYFGHPYIIWLYSNFGHQFAILQAVNW